MQEAAKEEEEEEMIDVAAHHPWKVTVYLLLNRPERYHLARTFSVFSAGLILTSVVFFVLSTEQAVYDDVSPEGSGSACPRKPPTLPPFRPPPPPCLSTNPHHHQHFHRHHQAPWLFDSVETFTVLVFTVEYFLRVSTLSVAPRKLQRGCRVGDGSSRATYKDSPSVRQWMLSVEGLVDMLSIAPWWIEKIFGRGE